MTTKLMRSWQRLWPLRAAGYEDRHRYQCVGEWTAVSSAYLWAELRRAASYRSLRHALEPDGEWSTVEKLLVEHRDIEFESVAPTRRWVPEDSDDDWVIVEAKSNACT